MALSRGQIEVLHAVVATRSITATTQLVKNSQPSLSRMVRRLEPLFITLFERTRRGLVPTAEALRISATASAARARASEALRSLTPIMPDLGSFLDVLAVDQLEDYLVTGGRVRRHEHVVEAPAPHLGPRRQRVARAGPACVQASLMAR